jgi:hypothetical protein
MVEAQNSKGKAKEQSTKVRQKEGKERLQGPVEAETLHRKRDVVLLHCCNSANATTKDTSHM